jgi:methanethiol S-methyltransferase
MELINICITVLLWTSWCVTHSLLNSEGPLKRFSTRFGGYYRLLYNLFAVISLVTVFSLMPRENQVQIWKWHGPAVIARVFLWAIALTVAYSSFRLFDIKEFLGIDKFTGKKKTDSGKILITSGIYSVVRHPQYLAGLILLWARDLTEITLAMNVVLSGYLLLGAKIEERRLIAMHGSGYTSYMQRVPGFIPNPSDIINLLRGKPHEERTDEG